MLVDQFHSVGIRIHSAHTHTHTHAHAHIHTHTHTHTHACMQTANTHARTHALTHMCTRTLTFTHTHTHTHTYIHTHSLSHTLTGGSPLPISLRLERLSSRGERDPAGGTGRRLQLAAAQQHHLGCRGNRVHRTLSGRPFADQCNVQDSNEFHVCP